MNLIRYFDFFNIKFQFYYENRVKINIFGGIMSLICIITCIIASLLLSLDDIRKINPKTTKSEVPGGEFRLINLGASKIWIPWRLITYEEKFIDHRGILYPMISLIEGAFNEEIGMDLKYHNLKYKLCNETEMANITDMYKIDTPLNELFCLEQSDINFGGSWLGDNLFYLEINLFLCEDGIEFNATDSRCTRLNELVNYTNTTWLFEFYYPVVQFQPTNNEIPMVVIYKNYYYRLSSYTYKVERLYIQENILSDDKSLFNNNYINTSCWGISTVYGDTYFWKETHDPLVKSNSSCLFSLDIYMDQGRILYTRSYTKIYEIFSNVFPVLNVLFFIFEKITILIKFAFAKKSIVELLFENKHIKYKNKFSGKNIKNNEISKYTNDKIYLNNFNDIYKLNNNYNINNSNHKENLLNQKKVSKIGQTSDNSLNKSGISLFTLYSKIESNKRRNTNNLPIIKKVKKSKGIFPIFYYFMDIFIDKLDKPKSFCCLDKKYLIVYNFVEKIFNISSYILLFKYFNIYKKIFSNDLKKMNINNVNKKINISDKEMMANIEQTAFENNKEDDDVLYNTLIT